MGIIFREFFILYRIFFSPQVKQSMFIIDKHGIYEWPHKLPNKLNVRILGNWERSGKSQNSIEL